MSPTTLESTRSSAEWRFLGVLPRSSRGLATAWWTLIAVRGALPAIFTLAMGALVGAVQGPLSQLVGLLTAPQRELTYVLAERGKAAAAGAADAKFLEQPIPSEGRQA